MVKLDPRNRNVWIILLPLIIVTAFVVTLEISILNTQSSFEWETSTPEQQKMNAGLLNNMTEFIQDEGIPVHSVLVIRNDFLVYEEYFSGFSEERRHELWSCTKSVTSALIGIAIDKGYFALDDLVLDLFPNKTFQNVDERKQRLSVKHLLTMSTGLEWAGDTEYVAMGSSETDWVQYILDKPMVAEPGDVFNYHTGGSHVLSALIQTTTGNTTLEFAQKYLFEPVGIESASWIVDNQDFRITRGGEGLYMTPRDMARFGLLYLHDGSWNGKQVIPKEWIEASTKSCVLTDRPWPHFNYGYQFWTYPSIKLNGQSFNNFFAARGLYEQLIYVFPESDLVVVFTSHVTNYNLPGPDYLLYEFILPAILPQIILDKIV